MTATVDAVELLRLVVEATRPSATLVLWSPTTWAERARARAEQAREAEIDIEDLADDFADEDSPTIYYRVTAADKADDGAITAAVQLVGVRLEPATVVAGGKRALIGLPAGHDLRADDRVPVGPGAPLRGEQFLLNTWRSKHSGSHAFRYSITFTGRLGAPEPVKEPVVVKPWPSGFTPAAAW